MNVAEDVRDPFAAETHPALASCFIQTQIESFAVVKRKHIVKKRVIVGKLHQAANGYNQQMRIELLVLLHHPVGPLLCGQRRCAIAIERC